MVRNLHLTDEIVRMIRQKYEDDITQSYITLGKEYNVKPSTISRIIRRETWKHVLLDSEVAAIEVEKERLRLEKEEAERNIIIDVVDNTYILERKKNWARCRCKTHNDEFAIQYYKLLEHKTECPTCKKEAKEAAKTINQYVGKIVHGNKVLRKIPEKKNKVSCLCLKHNVEFGINLYKLRQGETTCWKCKYERED